jgi:predicted dehydrogenase
MAPLKLAFLGSWHSHAAMHVREAARRPDEFQLVGMYDSDPKVISRRRKEWAELYPGLPVFSSVEKALESEAEAVIVEGEIHRDLEYAERALEAGKHVLLEKPAGVDLDHLARVHRLAERRGLMLQMAYMWRYNLPLREVVRLVGAGALGDIFYFRGHIPKPKSWHASMEEEMGLYKGATYFEMAGHLVDLMVSLMGEPKAVHPVLGRHYGQRAHVDNAVVVHEFDSGLATIDTAAMHVGMDRTRRIEVYGTRGTAIHTQLGSSNLSLCLEVASEGYRQGWQDITIEPDSDSPTLLRELADCIRGRKKPDRTLEHDMTVHRVLLAGSGVRDGRALASDAAGTESG